MSFVRLSVTLVDQDHISWKSWILIYCTNISPTPSLFVAQRPSTYSHGNMAKFWGDRRWSGESGVLEHKSGNISETTPSSCLEQKILWTAFRNSPTLFRMVLSPTPFLFPKIGVRNPHQKLQSLLSQERVKLQTSNFAGTFKGSIRTKTH